MYLLLVFPYLLLSPLQTNGDQIDYQSRDLTWEAGASGRDVVEATIQKIKAFSGVSQDFSILRRYALMESSFGEDEERVDANPGGGIWQIDPDVHNLSSILPMSPAIATLVNRMEEVFNIECLYCGYNFSTPMVSGLAVQAFNQFKYGPNTPGDITKQSVAWVDEYHPGQNSSNYTQVINSFNQDEDKFCDVDFKLDLWILLDDSEDISDEDFESQLNFTSALASKFSVSNSIIQIGFSVLSNNEHEIHFWFNESDSLSSLEAAVSDTKRNKLNLQTDEALKDIANNRFATNNGGRPTPDKDLRRVIVVITDNNVDDDIETASQEVEDSNTSVIVVAVCATCNETKLNLMATDPDINHVLTFDNYYGFGQDESKTKVYEQICDTVFAHSIYAHIETSLIESASTYADHDSLIEDVENQFSLQCFDCEDSVSTSVKNTLSDVFTASKVISSENSKQLKRELIAWSSEHNDEDCSTELKMELWFLLNGEFWKTGIDFEQQTTFVADLVTKFTISPTKVQVGLSVAYSNRYHVYFNLDQYSTVGDLETSIRNTNQPTNWRETGKALQDILDRGFVEESGARTLTSFVPRAVIIVTNGNNHIDYVDPGKNSYEANISVYGVAMGDYVNDTELEVMLSHPIRKYSYHLYEFDKLELYFIPEVYTSLCRSPIPLSSDQEMELELKQNVERYFWSKVVLEKNLQMTIKVNEAGTAGKAYVSVAVTEPNSVYYDISIDLQQGTAFPGVEISKLVDRHKGRIQGIEKWIVRDGVVTVYITLVSTTPTMDVTVSVKPVVPPSTTVSSVDSTISTTTAQVTSAQNNGGSANNNQEVSTTTPSVNGNSVSEQINADPNYTSDNTGSNDSVIDSTGSSDSETDDNGANDPGSNVSGPNDSGSNDTGSNDSGPDNNPSTTNSDVSVSMHSQAVSGSSNENNANVDSLSGLATENSTISSNDNSATSTIAATEVVDDKALPLDGGANIAGADPGEAERQTGSGSNSSLAALSVIPVVVFILLLAYYRSKKKKKIDPAMRVAAMEEVKEAMGKAKSDEAEHIDLLALESKIEAATAMQISEEELVEAKDTLTDLRQRLSSGQTSQEIKNSELC